MTLGELADLIKEISQLETEVAKEEVRYGDPSFAFERLQTLRNILIEKITIAGYEK